MTDKVTRKLTAILSADVKGYSILMADDELFTIKTLKEYRDIMTSCIEQHSGRVVDNPGDNILAEFGSAVDAVECAVEIQRKLKKENSRFVKDRRLQFRIGVNIGDVMQDSDRIYGSGVNVTARIEGVADPGGICISRNTYDHVKGKLDLNFECLGEHEVKNIKEPVRVYKVLVDPSGAGILIGGKKKKSKLKWVVVTAITVFVIILGIAGGLYWKYYYLPAPVDIDPQDKMAFDLPKGPTIAVLPFDNMTGDPEQETFCDGITDNLIAILAHAPRLLVIARNSTFTYKRKAVKVQQIGHELGAMYVIEGSVQKSSDKIRITIQLVETRTGKHIWSDIYDRELKDIFKLQDEIALEILKAMQITLTEGEKVRDRFEGVNDINLWLKLSKATNFWYQTNPTSNHFAQKGAYEIIEINPNISFAYTLLGATYLYDLWFDTCDSTIICFGKATEAVRKALILDSGSSDAHLLAAYLFLLRREHDKAIAEAKKAIKLSQNNADAYHVLGFTLNWAERPKEGIEFIKKAIKLNPIPNPFYLNSLGNSYIFLEDYIKAVEIFTQIVELDPNQSFTYSSLAFLYTELGRDEEAKFAVEELLKIHPNFSVKAFVKVAPFKNKNRPVILSESLRKAGLPE